VLVRTHEAMHKRTGALLTAEQWKEIVGERIAARTRVQSVFKGNLLVNAASSAWVAELSFLSADIVARLNAKGHEIAALKFRVEPLLEPNTKRPSRRPPSPNEADACRPSALPEDLVARLAHIEDPQLRGAIAEAAMKSLLGPGPLAAPGSKPPSRSSFPPAPSRKKPDTKGL